MAVDNGCAIKPVLGKSLALNFVNLRRLARTNSGLVFIPNRTLKIYLGITITSVYSLLVARQKATSLRVQPAVVPTLEHRRTRP